VRTGGPGGGGVSLLVMERGMPGLKTAPLLCSGRIAQLSYMTPLRPCRCLGVWHFLYHIRGCSRAKGKLIRAIEQRFQGTAPLSAIAEVS